MNVGQAKVAVVVIAGETECAIAHASEIESAQREVVAIFALGATKACAKRVLGGGFGYRCPSEHTNVFRESTVEHMAIANLRDVLR